MSGVRTGHREKRLRSEIEFIFKNDTVETHMANLKQRLIEETKNQIASKEREIKESDEELEMLEAKLKVENKFLEMKDIKEDLKEEVGYSIKGLENMLMLEKQRNAELKKDFEISKYRLMVIDKFGEGQL